MANLQQTSNPGTGVGLANLQGLSGADLLKSPVFLAAVDSAFETMGRYANLVLPSADPYRQHGGLAAGMLGAAGAAITGLGQANANPNATEFGEQMMVRALVKAVEHMPQAIAKSVEQSQTEREKTEAVEAEKRLEEARREEFLHPNNRKRTISYV